MSDADVDVLVAGAGAAGLAAALAASERGRSVLLVESRPTFREGSNTAMSTSMIPAGGTRHQRAAGLDDSPAAFLADVEHKTKGTADQVVARALTGVAPRLVHWLEDAVGIRLELVTDFLYPGHSQYRCHTVHDRAGSTLHRQLLEAATGRDGVELVTPLRLVDVELDDAGAVRAALTERPDGTRERIATAAVVLATNGYGAVPELVATHCPEIAGGLYFGGDGSTGDALAIGGRLDADVAQLDAYQGHGSVATPHGVLVTWATVMHGALLLNDRGERFGNEPIGYSEFAAATLAQPGGEAWTVFDRRIDEACLPFADQRRCHEAGAVREAADVDALAGLLGAPRRTVAATLADARAAALGEQPDPFGRTHWEAPLEPPFRAVRVTGALFHTQGGLRVDEHATVLRGGAPVPGLFAAGGAAVGMSGGGAGGYLAGNGLLAALGLGLLAGGAAGMGYSRA